MAVTKSLIFGMDEERSHVVERHGQGVYAEHLALVYTAKAVSSSLPDFNWLEIRLSHGNTIEKQIKTVKYQGNIMKESLRQGFHLNPISGQSVQSAPTLAQQGLFRALSRPGCDASSQAHREAQN